MELNFGTAPMGDDEVLRAFEACQLDPAKFQHAGVPQKFHYTTTIAWTRLVAAACCESDSCDSFYEWIKTHPQLLNKYLLREHYSAGKLESLQARCGWLEPDLKPLD